MSEAHARTGDPDTSHEAAASLDPDRLRRSQADVYWVISRYGPTTDAELIGRYRAAMRAGVVGYQSESGIRTRRNELVRRGSVVDSGKRELLPSGRHAVVWSAA